MKQEIRRIME